MGDSLRKTIVTVFEVTPVISTSAYTAADQIGGIQTISGAFQKYNRDAYLSEIVIVDADKEKAKIDFFFFDDLPTVVSVDNGAIDISDAEMKDKSLGFVSVLDTDYVDLANSSVATKLLSGPFVLKGALITSLYVVCCTRSTPTYTNANDLVFKYGIIQA